MQKRIFAVILVLLALSLAACAQETAPAQPQEPAAANTPVPAEEPAAEATATPAAESEAADAQASARTFTIAQDRSEVRFVIDELLRGAPKTVIGVNNQVTGQVAVDPTNAANTEIGPIAIDAASFVTDDDRRNGAIRRFILLPDRHPTINFVPTASSGLPASAAVGDSFDFQVTGDLTILDRTNPVTFDLTATAISENEIQITGATTINHADFGINIPSVPFVANVSETLALELDLVAVPTE
jgi:polyisoprenoid-binding protein YceI